MQDAIQTTEAVARIQSALAAIPHHTRRTSRRPNDDSIPTSEACARFASCLSRDERAAAEQPDSNYKDPFFVDDERAAYLAARKEFIHLMSNVRVFVRPLPVLSSKR